MCLYDQLGGVGSAAAIFPGTFRKNADGSYSGRLVGGPDRGQYTIQQPSVGVRLSYDFRLIGHNTQGTTDYFGRHQFFDFTLNRKCLSRYTKASTLQADHSSVWLSAYYGDVANAAIGSLQVSYAGGLEYTDTGAANGRTTGLDPTGVRAAAGA